MQVDRRRPPKRYEVDLSKVHDLYCNTTHCYSLKRQRKAAPRLPGRDSVEGTAPSTGTDVAVVANETSGAQSQDQTVNDTNAAAVMEATLLDVAAKEVLSSTFYQLHEDAATREFLTAARDPSHIRKAASHVLARFVSRTAANGITGSGGMFVLSSEQFDTLLEPVRGTGGCSGDITEDVEDVATTSSSPSPSSAVLGGMGDDSRETDAEVGGNAWVPLALRRYMANRSASSEVPLEGVMEVSELASLLVDIGAGDGGATSHLSGRFAHTWASEASRAMQIRLRRRGYRVVDFPSCCLSVSPKVVAATPPQEGQDGSHLAADLRTLLSQTPLSTLRSSPPCVLSCLNVLDRADMPMSLLRALHASLVAVDRFVAGRCSDNQGGSGGLPPKKAVCLLALVLPWCPFVEGWSGHKEPTEPMPMSGGRCNQGAPFEAAVFTFVRNVLIPLGFRVVRWSRVPYLCEGDNTTEYYALDDAVFVLESATP